MNLCWNDLGSLGSKEVQNYNQLTDKGAEHLAMFKLALKKT